MNKKIKGVALGVAMIMTTAFMAGCGQAEKIGYVDRQKIQMESAKGQEIMQKLAKKEQDVTQRLAKLEKTEDKEKFAQEVMKARQELAMYRMAMEKEFENAVTANVSQIARDKELTVVVAKEARVSGGEDLTDQVLAKMGKKGDAPKADASAEKKEAPAKAEQAAPEGEKKDDKK